VSSRGLDEYRRKRDPAQTPEPFGGSGAGAGNRFVVHKHSARRLHYDLRLEIDGVRRCSPRDREICAALAIVLALQVAQQPQVGPKSNLCIGHIVVSLTAVLPYGGD